MFQRIKPLFPLILLTVAWLGTGTLRAEPEMLIGIDRTEIYQGESFIYQVLVSDSSPIDDSAAPEMSAFTDFQVKTHPKQVQTSGGTSIRQVINGQVVRDETTPVTHIVRYSYTLTPTKTGKFTVPAPKVTVGGKTLTASALQVQRQVVDKVTDGGAISVTVLSPDEQDIAKLSIEIDRQRLYPFQPVTVTLVVRIKEVPGNFAGKNPINLLKNPPQLLIPWAENDAALPKGIVPRQKLDDWLNSMLVRRPGRGAQGFAINEHADDRINMGFDDDWFSRPFSARSMMQKVPYQFAPTPKSVKLKNGDGLETTYWEYRFSRTFRPEELGDYTFGPAMLKGALAIAAPETREGAAAKSIYAITPPVTVHVVDVPRENRPDSYLGAFGTFQWSVDLQPRKAKVGEPMTLTFRLTGQGSTVGVKPPDLSTMPEIADCFRTYPPTEEVDDDICTFTYTIRPTKTGVIEFPAIPASFFDVEKEEFVTLRSDPISLEISEAPILQSNPVYAGPGRNRIGDLELSEKGIFANMTDPGGVTDQSVDYRLWMVGLIFIASVYGVLALGVTLWRRLDADPRRRRKRAAPSLARQRLAEMQHRLKEPAQRPIELGADLQAVFFGYVADLTDGIQEGMTTKDACRKLLELGAETQTVAEVRGLLETLDGARYGGLDVRSLDDLAASADRLLKNLNSEIQ